MDLSKLSTMQKVLGGAAVVLLIDMFLPWYGVGAAGIGSVNFNAWRVGILAWLGCLLVIAGAALVLLKVLGTNEVKAGTLQTEHLGLILTGLGTALILLRFVTATNFTKFGLYIGIVAAGVATFAAFQTMREAGLDVPTGDDFRSLGGPGDGGGPGGPQDPGQAPGQAPGQTPDQAPGQTPGQTPDQTPGQGPGTPGSGGSGGASGPPPQDQG